MGTRRILVQYHAGRGGEALLRQTLALARAGDEVRVVRVIDTRSAIDADGPAGRLPCERASRTIAFARARLERALQAHGLAQAQAVVLAGVAADVVPDLVDTWHPDVVLCERRMARRIAPRTAHGAEVIPLRAGLLDRLARRCTPLMAGVR